MKERGGMISYREVKDRFGFPDEEDAKAFVELFRDIPFDVSTRSGTESRKIITKTIRTRMKIHIYDPLGQKEPPVILDLGDIGKHFICTELGCDSLIPFPPRLPGTSTCQNCGATYLLDNENRKNVVAAGEALVKLLLGTSPLFLVCGTIVMNELSKSRTSS
ncbi:MAG: hypothetical protein GTN80_07235 [Nitrososphaeria archaeon]|nr:hypothetical protein [Nitrososphaeria archaeon]NIQ33419.1 hypothetical protein [Nitrososphaeria archaeon]